MPIPHDTAVAVGVEREGVNFRHCYSRSLILDRFANPVLKKDDRSDFFLNAFKKTPIRDRLASWRSFLSSDLGLVDDAILFAQLRSRLMVNMAGGVMENAGLCLDRFGVPFIPGSAVKGCARRMAIQDLLAAREAKEPTDNFALLLADIALVFGWSELEWKLKSDLRPNRVETDEEFQKRWEDERSDFAFGCGDALWPLIHERVRNRLCAELKCMQFPKQFSGTINFLPAYPCQLPQNDLELDVVTCHHPDYYGRKSNERGELVMPIALDSEQRIIPVVFPTISPGRGTEQDRSVFAFVVLPLRGERHSLSQPGTQLHLLARNWLSKGLATLGLGAKTAAGYGWFKEIKPSQKSPSPTASTTTSSAGSNAQAVDYTEVSFRNAILNCLDRPQDYELLKREIEILRKPANLSWVTRLKQALATKDFKDARKRLRDKDWFPKEWLPTT